MFIALIINTLEEVCVHPVICADGVRAQYKVQIQIGMSQTTEQLLVTGVFDFTTLFQPYDCNSIDRFQLFWLVHTLEDNLTLVRECKLERTFFGYNFLPLLLGAVSKEIHILKDLFE